MSRSRTSRSPGTSSGPTTRPISIIPIVLRDLGRRCSSRFYFVERAKERRNADPLFEFAHLRFKTYRYGLLTGLVLAMGQLGLSFVLPVFLQDGRHISPLAERSVAAADGHLHHPRRAGRWPAHQSHRHDQVVRIGLVSYVARARCSCCTRSRSTSPRCELLPGLAFYGIGIGFAGAQLTNVVLSEIPPESSGVRERREHDGASGRRRARCRGDRHRADGADPRATRCSRIKRAALAGGAEGAGPRGRARPRIRIRAAEIARARRARPSFASRSSRACCTARASRSMFAFVVVGLGSLISLLIPSSRAVPNVGDHGVDGFEPAEPLDSDPALLH